MIPALCCVCGTLREVSRQAFTISGNRKLKCETCSAMTMHALVLRGDDWATDHDSVPPPRIDLAGMRTR